MSFRWNDRDAWSCRHGYGHGDCPFACLACGHRCELHTRDEGVCEAVECACPGFTEPDEVAPGNDDDDGVPPS